MKIEIKYLGDIPPLDYIGGKKSNWIDLYCAETLKLQKNHFYMIPLGVAMKLPEGYEALLLPRSSAFKNYGIIQTNSIGVIDETYCGNDDEWKLPVLATKNTFIPKGTRICQFRIFEHQPDIEFNEVEDLQSPSRGGFGSTGV